MGGSITDGNLCDGQPMSILALIDQQSGICRDVNSWTSQQSHERSIDVLWNIDCKKINNGRIH